MQLRTIFVILAVTGFISSPLHAKGGKDDQLPPGLQKKMQKGKPLPPGWQKKLSKGETLDSSVYSAGRIVTPEDHAGVITIQVEGKIIRLMKATREIVDILQ